MLAGAGFIATAGAAWFAYSWEEAVDKMRDGKLSRR